MTAPATGYRAYFVAGVAMLMSRATVVASVMGTPAVAIRHTPVQLTATGFGDFDWSSLFGPEAGQLWSNIDQNLLVDIVNIPANWWNGVNTYANLGLGFPGITGTTQAPGSAPYDFQDPNQQLAQLDPNSSAPGADQGTLPDDATNLPNGVYPVSAPIGPDGEFVPLGFGGTGSWWMESVGNTWGWDEGNAGQMIGLSNMIVPIPQLSTPFAYELQAAAMQNIIANPQACPFECPDVLGYFGHWFSNLGPALRGDSVTVGLTTDGHPISPVGLPISWAGDQVVFNPAFIIDSFMNSLTADPGGQLSIAGGTATANSIDWGTYADWSKEPSTFFAPFIHYAQNLSNDFNPYVDGSFLYWGAPSLYAGPALVAGLVTSLTGGIVGNPFAQYTLAPGGAIMLEPYLGQDVIGNDGEPVTLDQNTLFPGIANEGLTYDALGHPITDAQLPAGLGAGLLFGVAGLLGYLDPYNYLGTLGITPETTLPELEQILGGNIDWLAEGVYDWHSELNQALMAPIADSGNELVPWYHDLTVGAGLDAFSQGTDVPL